MAPTGSEVDTTFFGCEATNPAASYIYFGWALYFPGLTDDPHVFHYSSSAADILGEMVSYFTSKGISAQLLTDFSSMMLGLVQRLQSSDINAINNDLDSDISVGSSLTVYRYREGIERFFITDINNPAATATAQSQIAVLSDMVNSNGEEIGQFNHIPGGGNVLYMDGHVDFIKYPGVWPISPLCAALLGTF
jgi:prepilin-type processing-associated H-X9-DG protein